MPTTPPRAEQLDLGLAGGARRAIHIPGGGDRMGGAPVDTNDAFRPCGR